MQIKARSQNKKLDLVKYLISKRFNEIIEVEESVDFVLAQKYEGKLIKKKLIFEFTKDNITSDISLKVALADGSSIEIEAVVIVPSHLKGCNSTLSMRAIVLDQKSKIHFTPTIEINNKNTSANHRSTIGTPNVKQIEYLESRGLNKKEATELIANSFLEQE